MPKCGDEATPQTRRTVTSVTGAVQRIRRRCHHRALATRASSAAVSAQVSLGGATREGTAVHGAETIDEDEPAGRVSRGPRSGSGGARPVRWRPPPIPR